jgi:hypothetical protein
MTANERVVRTIEKAIMVVKDPKSDQELYLALRLIAAVAKQESKKVLVNIQQTEEAV